MRDDSKSDIPASEGATVLMGPDETPRDDSEEAEEEATLGEQATLLKDPEELAATTLRAEPPAPGPQAAPLDDQLAVATVITPKAPTDPKAAPRPEGLRLKKEQASPAMKLAAVALATIAAILVALFYLFGYAGRRAPAPEPASAAAVEAGAPATQPGGGEHKAKPAPAPATP